MDQYAFHLLLVAGFIFIVFIVMWYIFVFLKPPKIFKHPLRDSQISIFWLPIDGSVSYRGYYRQQSFGWLPWNKIPTTNDCSLSFNSINGLNYEIIVQTVGYFGAFRSSDPIIACSRVSAPTHFRVSNSGIYRDRVTLNWTPKSTVMGYQIVRRRVEHDQLLRIVWESSNADACQFQDSDVIYGVNYQYAIFSIDHAGERVASDFVDVCIRAPPPKSFNAYLFEQDNNCFVVLQWDSVIGARGYIIQRRRGNVPFSDFKRINSSSVTRTEDISFQFGFNYTYAISSIDVIGRSMSAKLTEIFPRVNPPNHFTASYDPQKKFSINLSWTSVPKCLGYRIERIISNTTNNRMLVVNTADPSTTQFEDRFERYGINYLYKITARDHADVSDVGRTTTVCPRVSAPTDLKITYDDDRPNDIILQWKEVLGGTGYIIRRSDNQNSAEFIHMESVFNENKTEFIDKSFKCGLSYNYTVTSIDSAGLSETSAVISILPRAVSPKNLKVHFDNEKQNVINLRWEPVLQATEYVVHRAVIDSKNEHGMEEVTKHFRETNWKDNSFSHNTNYKYSVSSVDLAGVSGTSETVSIFTKVPDIDNLVSVYDETIGDVVSLEWRASSGATSYLVRRKNYECNEESAITLTGSTKSVTRVHDSTFKHGIQYEYTVMAMDSTKRICRLSKIPAILRVPVPAKFRVIYEDKLPKFILLRWECVPQALGYIIERSIDNKTDSDFVTIMNINNPFKIQIKDLYFNYGITYSYIVRAIDFAGPSAASKIVTVFPRVPPPESPIAVYDDKQQGVILQWNMMMGAIGYVLERTAPNYRQDILMTKELKGYSTTKEIDSSIICGITYRYVLFALDETGKSRGSKPVQICPRARGPRDLRIQYSSRTAYKANLLWNSSPHSKGYLVKRALGENDLHFESIKNIDDNTANEALDIPFICGIKNHFKVFSIDHAGSSQESNTVSIFPRISAPKNLKITLDDRNEPSIVIQWETIMNAKGYTVQRATGRKNRQFETIGSLNESCMTTFMESNLIWGVKYRYKVRATDASGPSYTYAAASIFVRAPSPKIEKVDLQDDDANPFCMIYWNKIPNVIGYQVKKQNCTEMTSFEKVRTVQHCSTTSFVDTSIRWGVSFQYTVTSIDKAGYSDCSEPFRVCFRATKPKLFHVKPNSKTNDELILCWQPNRHCKGYCIYRHCSSSESDSSTSPIIENPLDDEKYLLTLVNDPKIDIFTDRSLKSGIEYVYTITCIDELGKSSNYSSTKGKCALGCPDDIRVKPLDQQKMILLSWECVINADGYRIERLVAGKRTITVARIYGSNSTTFVDYTDLMYNEAYRYHIYAFDQKGESLPLTTSDAVTLIPSKEHSDSNAFIDIRFGNLCTEEVEAIAVCPTSEKLMQTILDAIGTTVKEELKMLNTSKLIEPVVLSAGQLSCKNLILIPWQPFKTLEAPLEKSVRRFITTALKLASEHGCNTIAFPALGCGAFGCNAATVAKTMTSEIDRQIRSPQCSVKRVSIIVEANKQNIFDTFRVQLRIQTDRNCQRSEERIPLEWIIVNDDYPLCVSITEDSDEYRSILEDFRELKTKHLFQNFRVERIQNRRLYLQYQVEKEYLEQQLNKDTERRLFHGCPNKKNAIQSIIENGFDRSLAGNHFGNRYGKGVYFSSRILESHKYAKDDETNKERTMFVCLVLLGRSTCGKSNMIVCPTGYHSTTDEDSIYAIFRDSQAYVQYIVYYK